MSRESGFQPEYGLMGAGAVNASLVGRLRGKTRALGPVAGVSYRVASRIANTLRAGTAVRSADELDGVRIILFHSPPDQMEALFELLKSADIRWPGKSLIFCDCESVCAMAAHFRSCDASVAMVRKCPLPGHMTVGGASPALTMAHRLARDTGMKPVEIAPGQEDLFDAAVTLGSGALTPLIDYAAGLLRQCGIRDTEAAQFAAALFEQTAHEYAHSGRQSWAWHIREPLPERIEAQIVAAGDGLRTVLSELILFGLDTFDKHPEAARALREALRIRRG